MDGQPFLLHDSGPGAKRIMAFATPVTIDFLKESPTWLADGMFRKAPKELCQTYTFQGFRNGLTVPSLFFFLPDKTAGTYKAMWKIVCELTGVEEVLATSTVTLHLDFEQTAISAAADVLGLENIKGCYFHFSQTVLRKVQEEGLSGRYAVNKEFRMRVGRMRALAFLPVETVVDAWESLESEFSLAPDDSKSCEIPLMAYFEKTCIGCRIRVRDTARRAISSIICSGMSMRGQSKATC